MNFLSNCLKGIAIGSGAILPGISSGVFCVIFGIYEKLLDSVLNFFSDFKNNFKFLFPIILGTGIGIFLLGNVLNYCLYQFPIQTKSIFIGLIVGSLPALRKQVLKRSTSTNFGWLFFFLAFCFGIICAILENILQVSDVENVNFLYLVISGFLMSIRHYCARC